MNRGQHWLYQVSYQKIKFFVSILGDRKGLEGQGWDQWGGGWGIGGGGGGGRSVADTRRSSLLTAPRIKQKDLELEPARRELLRQPAGQGKKGM